MRVDGGMSATETTPDPYRRCQDACTHDLARGVLLADLGDGDGPFPSLWVVSGFFGGGVVLPARLAASEAEAA